MIDHYFQVKGYKSNIKGHVISAGVQFSDFADGGHKTSRAIKGAPLESLFAQFCLHSLWFGNCNIRGIYRVGTN